MTRHARPAILGLAAMAAIGACSGDQPPSTPPASTPASMTPSTNPEAGGSTTRTSEGGQVTVVATWPGAGAGAELDVTLDTHSVDLDALDLADAILRNDRGETLKARPWAAPKGGHHREGTLTFDGDSTSFLDGATWIELVLTGVGDIPERTLRWEVGA